MGHGTRERSFLNVVNNGHEAPKLTSALPPKADQVGHRGMAEKCADFTPTVIGFLASAA